MNKMRIAGATAGVVLVSGMVLQVSSAAFTDTTDNPDNNWAAGTVYLSDSQAGEALFSSTAAKIVPGYSATKCLTVTYSGTVDPSAAISFAADVTGTADAAGGNGLADDIDVVVEMGPDGSTCVSGDIVNGASNLSGTRTTLHTGTLASLGAALPLDTWTPDGDAAADASSRTRSFKFSVAMPAGSATPNDAQGDTATATFSWSSTAGD